jgi:hypothetical protein
MDIAGHIRIFDKTPSDDLVTKRTATIGALAKKYEGLSTVDDLLQLAADLTKGVAKKGSLPESRMIETEEAIRVGSVSFVREGQHLQILTCALLAARKLLVEAPPTNGDWSRRDVLALGLWSGLGFQNPRTDARLEALRSELLEASRKLVSSSAANARKRHDVPAIVTKLPDAYDPGQAATSIQNSANACVDALRLNAALDREELDLLWWALNGRSTLANKFLSTMDYIAIAVAAGLEVGKMVRRMPVDAHKNLMLRLLTQEQRDQTVNMHEILESVAPFRDGIVDSFKANRMLHGRESIFPLVVACLAGKVEGKTPAATHSLSLSDWGARALLESSILHLSALPKHLV